MAKKKKGEGDGENDERDRAFRQFEQAGGASPQAGSGSNVTSFRGQGGGAGMGGGGPVAQLEVAFDPASAPPPAFAGVCVVHRFPEYVLIDFGSIDPLRVEPGENGGQKAALQHVGRVCLPESAAKKLLGDLMNIYGGG